MYLCETWSSNLGFGLIDDPRFVEGEAGEHINARVARATALITGALELRRKTYLHQELDAAGDDSAARKQLMSHGDASKTQRFLFGTTRRPGPAAGKLDVLAHFAEHESEHFTVLCNNRIGADGAQALAEAFRHNTALTTVNLYGNEFGGKETRLLRSLATKKRSTQSPPLFKIEWRARLPDTSNE